MTCWEGRVQRSHRRRHVRGLALAFIVIEIIIVYQGAERGRETVAGTAPDTRRRSPPVPGLLEAAAFLYHTASLLPDNSTPMFVGPTRVRPTKSDSSRDHHAASVESWSAAVVSQWLHTEGFPVLAATAAEHRVDGGVLLELTSPYCPPDPID